MHTLLRAVRQRDSLRLVVRSMARSKVVGGRVVTGPQLANLVVRVVEALNARDMPTGSSLVEYFNKEVRSRCCILCNGCGRVASWWWLVFVGCVRVHSVCASA